LGLDVKIIGMTVLKVVKREGISAEGHATMEEFMGTQRRKGAKIEAQKINTSHKEAQRRI
jgi:hypothetical protein